MKINPSYRINPYLKTNTVPGTAAVHAANGAKQDKKVDTIVISHEGSAQGLFSGMVKQAAEEITASHSPARLEQIKAAVENGSYHVSSMEIAKAMLGHLMA